MSHMIHNGFMKALVVAKNSQKTVRCVARYRSYNKKYKLYRWERVRIMAHDEFEECDPGDRVILKQSRPISKRKHFIVCEIAKKYPPVEFLKQHPELAPSKEAKGLEGDTPIKKKKTSAASTK